MVTGDKTYDMGILGELVEVGIEVLYPNKGPLTSF
jgi:hypothetical protein